MTKLITLPPRRLEAITLFEFQFVIRIRLVGKAFGQ
jgi:hypothetical protein